MIAPQASRAVRAGWALLLLAALVVAFWPSFGGTFVYDDVALVAKNPRIHSFAGVLEGMRSPHFGFEDAEEGAQVGYWRPLTVIALALGRLMGDGEPFAFHLLSFALHFLATLACWRFARLLSGSAAVGFGAALLFGLHPVHVESVAWISAVNDPLFGALALFSLASFVAWRRHGARGTPVLSGVFCLLALLAKEQALAVLPAVIAIDLALFLGRTAPGEDDEEPPSLVRAYGPLVAAVFLYWLARVFVFGDLLAGFDRVNAHFGMDLARATSYRVELFGGFLGLLAFPLDLVVFRQVRPQLPPMDPGFWSALAAIVVWLALVFYTWRSARRVALAALLFVPATLLPVLLYIEAAGSFPLSDRYLYIAVAGAAVLATVFLHGVLPRKWAFSALALVAVACGARTFSQTRIYEDDETFFRTAVRVSPDVPGSHWGLGRVLLNRYRAEREKILLDEAFLHYLQALTVGTDYGEYGPRVGPDAPIAERVTDMQRVILDTPVEVLRPDPYARWEPFDRLQANLGQGWCFLYLAELPPHDLEAPELVFQELTQVFPNSYHAYTGLGTVYMEKGEYQKARDAFHEALERNPLNAEAWHNLALTLTKEGDWDAARKAYEKALERRPGHLEDMVGVAATAMEAGRDDMADVKLAEVRRKYPDALEPLLYTGLLAAKRRQFTQALAWFDRVLEVEPKFGRAHLEKGKVRLQLGQNAEAIRALGRACELMPRSFEAHYMLGAVLPEEEAGRYLLRAYQIGPPAQVIDPLHLKLAELVEGDARAFIELALVSESRADWVRALDWTERALQADLDGMILGETQHRRGRILGKLDRPAEAAAAYRACLAAAPEHFWAHHDLGFLLANRLGLSAEAQPLLARALELLPDTAGVAGTNIEAAVRDALTKKLEALRAQVGPPRTEPE